MNVFEAVKLSVTTRQAAEHYGIRVGRNGIVYDADLHKKANLPVKKTVPKLTFEQRYEQMKTKCIRVLLDYRHLLRRWKEIYAPKSDDETWHPRFCEVLQDISYIEYLLDILLFGETEEQAAVIAEQGKKVMELEQRIRESVSADETEPIRNNGCDGAGTDSGGNPGNAGLYTERFSEKQSA